MKIRILLVATILSTTGACGGGGTDAAPVAPVEATTPPVVENDNTAAKIQVPAGFDFATSRPLDIDLAADVPDKTYLTVCRSYSAAADSGFLSDYEHCLLRTAVRGGQYRGRVEVPNDVTELAVTVWSFDPVQAVRAVTWEREPDMRLVVD